MAFTNSMEAKAFWDIRTICSPSFPRTIAFSSCVTEIVLFKKRVRKGKIRVVGAVAPDDVILFVVYREVFRNICFRLLRDRSVNPKPAIFEQKQTASLKYGSLHWSGRVWESPVRLSWY